MQLPPLEIDPKRAAEAIAVIGRNLRAIDKENRMKALKNLTIDGNKIKTGEEIPAAYRNDSRIYNAIRAKPPMVEATPEEAEALKKAVESGQATTVVRITGQAEGVGKYIGKIEEIEPE